MVDDFETLLRRIKENHDRVWTFERIHAVLGPQASTDTCIRLLRRLERMRVLVPSGDGAWVLASWPGGGSGEGSA